MRTCHNMNIIVQTTCGDASSINGKSESPNKTLANITRALFLNSSHKKELWCFAYQFAIWISRRNENRLCGDVPYFHGMELELHTNITKYGVWESISSMDVLQEKQLMIDNIRVILWDIQLLQELIYTGNKINHLLFTEPIMFGLMNIILASP